MNKETCCNWNETLRRCEALKEKCNSREPVSGQKCNFYKTKEQKKIDDKRTSARLKAIGFDKTPKDDPDKYSYENMKEAYAKVKGENK